MAVPTTPRMVEKLATLGKMSAALAHELNNPATAANRAAAELREAVRQIRRGALDNDCRFNDTERRAMRLLLDGASGAAGSLSGLARADEEQRMSDWLELQGCDDAWSMAPDMLDAGVDLASLQALGANLQEGNAVAAMDWLHKLLRMQALVEDVERSTARIREVVGAMKDASRGDVGEARPVDIERTLETTLLLFNWRLKNGIQVRRDYTAGLPEVVGFVGGLHQVWTNLIDNALDAMPDGGVLTVRTEAVEHGVRVSIGDSGVGMPDEIREHIFEPFYTTKSIKGTGLGLDISKRIVEEHQGTIEVRSQPGETWFQVTLPTAKG